MQRPTLVLACLALVALAGCGGLIVSEESVETPTPESTATPMSQDDTTDTETATATPTATTPTATDSTDTTTATPTPTPDGTLSSDNPWNQEIVPVRINDSAADGRNTTAQTVRALSYWNADNK
jgi:hypothetical protein